MNPEENNTLANPGASSPSAGGASAGASSLPGSGSLSMADSLASAEDNLTSAGLAASGQANNTNLTQLGGEGTSQKSPFAPVDEPLTPAAPVPGSLGSATSGPAIPQPMSGASSSATMMGTSSNSPFATGATSTSSTMPTTSAASGPMTAPAVSPQPYNPFATTTSSSNFSATSPAGMSSSTPASAATGSAAGAKAPVNPFNGARSTSPAQAPAVNPAFQPAPKSAQKAKDGAKSHSNIPTIILGGLTVIAVIVAVIFAIMYFNAVNNPKVVYVPSVSDEQSNATIRTLSCTRDGDFGYLLGEGSRFVGGTEQLTANYADDQLSGVVLTTTATYGSEEEANNARNRLEALQSALAQQVAASFTAEYIVEGNTLKASMTSKDGQLAEADANALLFGNNPDLTGSPVSFDAVEDFYGSNGYICTAE